MAKVNKTDSLDPETFMILENYCASSDNWEKKMSRTKVGNDAIRWFLSEDVAEQIHNHQELLERYTKLLRERDKLRETKPRNRPWWRRLLLGQ